MLPHIASRVFNTPLFISPQKAEVILWALRNRLNIEVPKPDASRFIGTMARSDRNFGLTRAAKGVALVDVYGTLVNRGAYIGESSGVTSYEGIRAQIADAVNDPEIHSILLVVDSPGGEASGMFTLSSVIQDARKRKRVVAVVDDYATSAAYCIAASAHEIWLSKTSTVGSIGVVLVHLDHSAELEMAGIRPTIIKAGAKKATGNPYQPLSESDIADLSALVSRHYEAFIQAVSSGRGERLTAKAAQQTEAALYIGEEAIKIGLADRIGTVEEAVEYLSARAANGAARKRKGAVMSETEEIYTPEEIAKIEARARAEERARIAAIVRGPAAKGREKQAIAMALDTDISPDQAVALLEQVPQESAVPRLQDRMTHHDPVGNPAAEQSKGEPGASWADIHAKVARQMGFAQ